MPAIVVSIQVGRPCHYGHADAADPHQRPWTTGFFKQPVSGEVFVGRTNLEGDGQADLKVHGGPDKAVLAYSADHYPLWRQELPALEFCYGGFGENLSITGLDERQVRLGDVLAVGPVRLVVSQPRQPCWKLARRWRMNDLPDRVIANGRTGWYLRVQSEGLIHAGLPVTLVERPHPQWTIDRVNEVRYRRQHDHDAAAALAECAALSQSWRSHFAQRLAKRSREGLPSP